MATDPAQYAGILAELKAGGYKVVHMKAKEQLSTQPEYDDMVMKELNPSGVMARPMSSETRTSSGHSACGPASERANAVAASSFSTL